jgi:hypothetical protein
LEVDLMETSVAGDRLSLTMNSDEAKELRAALKVARAVLVTLRARAEMQTTSACFGKLDDALSVAMPNPARTMDDHA